MDAQFVDIMNMMLVLIVSLSFHEWAHAYVATKQGDPTPKSEGRLTLNPLVHIDWMFTVALPLIMMITSGWLIGWAKPVHVNPSRFKNKRWGDFLVAFAGPGMNIILCLVAVFAYRAYLQFNGTPDPNDVAMALIKPMIQLNALLAVFNLIPFPPLDGGTVFPALLPKRLQEVYKDYVAPYGAWIVIAIMISGASGFLQTGSMLIIGFSDMLVSGIFTPEQGIPGRLH